MTGNEGCPDPASLAALLRGTLPPEREDEVNRHLDACAACAARAQELEQESDPLIQALRQAKTPVLPDPAIHPTLATTPHLIEPVAPAAFALEGYRILGELGRGGMGLVYKAFQHRLNRVVAVKMILAGQLARGEERVRFLLEGALLARLNHPNFVQVFEVGTVEASPGALQPYLVLEYIDGGSLKSRLAGKPLPPREAAGLALTLARAMKAAHAQGIVHRDLKPANVLIAAEGTLKITDFGLAKELGTNASLTPTGLAVGTPSYMAPEQAQGRPDAVGPAADVYALGAILYEMLTGRPPFQGDNPLEVLLQVIQQAPPTVRSLNPAVPRDLETICLKCLEKPPARRYATTGDLEADLESWLDNRPIQARPAGRVERVVKWARRNPVVAVLLAVVFASLAGGAGAFYWMYREADAAARGLAAEKQEVEAAHAVTLEERDRAETNQVKGLLRPLQAADGPVSPQEAEALGDLRGLPTERLQVLFLDQGLARPETTEKLRRRAPQVAHALVGLDRDRALRLCAVLAARARGTDDPRSDDACADLLTALMPRGEESKVAPSLVEVLTRRLATEKDPAALRELAGRLAALAPRLGPDDAVVAAEAVARRLLTSDKAGGPPLSAALVALAGRLDRTGAAAVAKPLARQLTDAANPFAVALDHLAPPLAALLARLPESEAAELAGKAVHTLTQMFTRFTYVAAAVAPHVAALAVRMGEEEAEAAARAVAQQFSMVGDAARSRSLAAALLVLVNRLDEAKGVALSRPAAKELARRMEGNADADKLLPVFWELSRRLNKEEAAEWLRHVDQSFASQPATRLNLWGPLVQAGGPLGPAEVTELAGKEALALADTIDAEKGYASLVYECQRLQDIWGYVGDKAAVSVVVKVGGTLQRENASPGRAAQELLASLLAGLAQGRQEEAAAEAARCLAKSVCPQGDWRRGYLCVALRAAAGRLPAADMAATTRALAAQVDKQGFANGVEFDAAALAAVARRAGRTEAAEAAQLVAGRMARTVERPENYRDLAVALGELAGRLPPAEATAAVTTPARDLTRRMAAEPKNDTEALAWALAALAPYLAEADAAAAFRTTAGRLAGSKHTSKALAGLCEALAGLAGRVGAKETGDVPAAAARLVERLAVEQEHKVPEMLAAALQSLARRLDERELVNLLQAPLCWGEASRVVLGELGRRAGRPFADGWEFAAWARAHRPGLLPATGG